MENTLFIQLLIGPLFLVLAIIFKLFPPKSINNIYGYRTSYSMRSQAVWDEANRFSCNLMVGTGVIVIIAQIISHFMLEVGLSLTVPIVLLVVLLIAIIPITERHLRKNFDKEGNPHSAINK